MAIMKNIPVANTSQFDYYGSERKFVGFASDLRVGQIYDDACDEGFWLESGKTKNKILITGYEIVNTDDNEIEKFIFTSNNSSNPEHLRDIVVNIYND